MSRTQCKKCPWRTDVDPHDIPNGYSVKKHRGLRSTIAEPGTLSLSRDLRMMACHETHKTPCAGWLANQLGPGNNLGLRLAVMSGHIDADIQLVGAQHETLDDTLPETTP